MALTKLLAAPKKVANFPEVIATDDLPSCSAHTALRPISRILLMLATAILLAGCATPISKGSQCAVAPGYLQGHTTYSWHTDPAVTLDDDTSYISPVMLSQLQQAVVQELQRKGLNYVDPELAAEPADLRLALTLNVRRELHSITAGESPCQRTDCWERIDMSAHVRMDVRTVGFLSVDAYHADQPIWRGWVERPLYPADRDRAGAVISQAVPVLFESFPP